MFESVVAWISHVSSLHSSVFVNEEFPPYDAPQKKGSKIVGNTLHFITTLIRAKPEKCEMLKSYDVSFPCFRLVSVTCTGRKMYR